MQENLGNRPIIDFLALLYVLARAREHQREKIQEGIFLIEEELARKGLSGPHFSFVCYMTGPFSSELSEALDQLRARGFVERDKAILTERGRFLAELVLPDWRNIPDNRPIFENIDRTLERYQSHAAVESSLSGKPIGQTVIAPSGDNLWLPKDLERLFQQEFELTDAQIDAAQKEWPELEARALARLRTAMNDGPQDR
jgi:uncharacterized protein YwgA